MLKNIVKQWETQRCVISIVSTLNWKAGDPINPNIPKWLVHIRDKFIEEEGECITDKQFYAVAYAIDLKSLKLLIDAFHIKEEHNSINLINPERRFQEEILERIYIKRLQRGERQ